MKNNDVIRVRMTRKIKFLSCFPYDKSIFYVWLCLLVCLNPLFAQHVEWSSLSKKSRNGFSQILGENEKGIYVLRSRNAAFTQDLSIEWYKSNLSFQENYNLPINFSGNIERVLMTGNVFHVFLSAQNTQTGRVDFLYQALDENLKIMNPMRVLFSINPEQMNDRTVFYVRSNAKQNHFVIFFLANTNEADQSELAVFCYDKNMQQQYFKTQRILAPVKDIFITSYELSNESDFIVLCDIPADLNHRNDRDKRLFMVHAYFNVQDIFKTYPIGDPNYRIQDITMTMNNFIHQVHISGFAIPFERKQNAKVFYYSIDCINNKSILTSSFNPIISDRAKRTQAMSIINDMPDLYIRKMISRSDGGSILIAEKYNVIRQPYTYYINGFPQTNMRTIFNYEDLYIINIATSGDIEQFDIVTKSQSSGNDAAQFASLIPVITSDNIYMLYNSDISSENDIMLGYLNTNGMLDKKILVKSINGSGLLFTNEWKQTGPNSIICCALKNKRFTLMRVTF